MPLTISRRQGEKLIIDGRITVAVAELSRTQCRLTIDAPGGVAIVRDDAKRKTPPTVYLSHDQVMTFPECDSTSVHHDETPGYAWHCSTCGHLWGNNKSLAIRRAGIGMSPEKTSEEHAMAMGIARLRAVVRQLRDYAWSHGDTQPIATVFERDQFDLETERLSGETP